MSDFGTIVSPFQVAPARGNIQDYGNFALQQEQTDAIRMAQALAQATRAYLTQQNGLPGNIDPVAAQSYKGEDQRQMIAGQSNQRANAMEGRAAGDHTERTRYANEFMGRLPQQTDPLTAAAQGAGGVHAAEFLGQLLGGNYQRQGEMQNRTAMNDADNVAAQKRLETQLTMQNDANLVTEGRKKADESQQEQKLKEALIKGQTTGDWSDFFSLAPNAMGSPTMYDRENESKDKAASAAAAQKQAEQDAKDYAKRPSPVGQVQESTNQKSRGRVIFEHTPLGAAIGKNAEGKPNMQTFAEHTPLGYIARFLNDYLTGPSGVPIDPKQPIK